MTDDVYALPVGFMLFVLPEDGMDIPYKNVRTSKQGLVLSIGKASFMDLPVDGWKGRATDIVWPWDEFQLILCDPGREVVTLLFRSQNNPAVRITGFMDVGEAADCSRKIVDAIKSTRELLPAPTESDSTGSQIKEEV